MCFLIFLLHLQSASAITFEIITPPSEVPSASPSPSISPGITVIPSAHSNNIFDHSTTETTHEEDNTDEEDFSVKDKALALAPKFSAFLSICGSGYIIYDVIGTGQAFHSTHHRLLMGMSICTLLVSSLAFFMSTWPIPRTSGVYLAAGNQATCDAQGFFSQFSLSVVIYNASLSAYYVAKVVYQCKTSYIHFLLEPFFHIFPLTAGLGTAFAGVFLDLYNNDGGWQCWIAAWPEDCTESWTQNGEGTTCIRGDNASIYRWVFYYGILWLAIAFVLVNMSLVYRSVYAQEMKMNQYNFEYQRQLEKLEKARLEKILAQLDEESEESDESDGSDSASVSSAMSYVASVASASVSRGVRSIHSISRQSVRALAYIPSQIPGMKKQHQSLRAHFVHSRRVSRQGYWFCGAFLATWMFPTVHRLVQLGWQMDLYPLHLLTAIFVPIQGFFNFLVYIQTRIQKKHIMNAFCCLVWLWKHPLKSIKLKDHSRAGLGRGMGSSADLLGSSDDSSSDSDDDSEKPVDSETMRPPSDLANGYASVPHDSILNKQEGTEVSLDMEAALHFQSEITDEGDDEFVEEEDLNETMRPNNFHTPGGRASVGSTTTNRSSTRSSVQSRRTSSRRSARAQYRAELRKSLKASLNASIQRLQMHELSDRSHSAAASDMTSSAKSHYSNNNTGRNGVSVERAVILEDEVAQFQPFEISTANGLSLTTDADDISSVEGDGKSTATSDGSGGSISVVGHDETVEPERKHENSVDRLRFVGDLGSSSSSSSSSSGYDSDSYDSQ